MSLFRLLLKGTVIWYLWGGVKYSTPPSSQFVSGFSMKKKLASGFHGYMYLTKSGEKVFFHGNQMDTPE